MAVVERYVPQEMRRYLEGLGIVRRPSQPGSAPACYMNDPDGPKQPSEAEPVTVHLLQTTGFGKGRLMEHTDYPVVDVTIRALPTKEAQFLAWETARKITRALDSRERLTMGNIVVLGVYVWREFGMIPSLAPKAGIYIIGSFEFRVRASELTETV